MRLPLREQAARRYARRFFHGEGKRRERRRARRATLACRVRQSELPLRRHQRLPPIIDNDVCFAFVDSRSTRFHVMIY